MNPEQESQTSENNNSLELPLAAQQAAYSDPNHHTIALDEDERVGWLFQLINANRINEVEDLINQYPNLLESVSSVHIPNIVSLEAATPFGYACAINNKNMAAMLHSKGANLDGCTTHGNNALMLAAELLNLDILEFLLGLNHFNLATQNKYGKHALNLVITSRDNTPCNFGTFISILELLLPHYDSAAIKELLSKICDRASIDYNYREISLVNRKYNLALPHLMTALHSKEQEQNEYCFSQTKAPDSFLTAASTYYDPLYQNDFDTALMALIHIHRRFIEDLLAGQFISTEDPTISYLDEFLPKLLRLCSLAITSGHYNSPHKDTIDHLCQLIKTSYIARTAISASCFAFLGSPLRTMTSIEEENYQKINLLLDAIIEAIFEQKPLALPQLPTIGRKRNRDDFNEAKDNEDDRKAPSPPLPVNQCFMRPPHAGSAGALGAGTSNSFS